MTREEILYLIPYLIALAVSANALAYAWSKKNTPGAIAVVWYMLGHTLWITGFIFELLGTDLASKLFWNGFQWLAEFLALIALPIFAVQYTGHNLLYAKKIFQLSLVVPASFTLLLFLDQKLHWVYANPRLTPGEPFAELIYDSTPAISGYALYASLVILWGLYILARRAARPHNLYRAQTGLIALGFFISLFGAVFSLSNVHLAPQRDITPFTSAVGNLIITWSVFRFRIFEITPIARDKVFEALAEPVVILDNQNLIVDVNTSMLNLLGKNASDVIGESAKEIFDDFPIPIKRHIQTSYARAETALQIGGKDIHYEMTVWPIYDERKNMSGRIFISHDITALKELERDLRDLNVQLEDRVRARTRDLAEAYDTTLEGWARTLELRDKETEGHTRRVTDMTLKIAVKMGIMGDDLEQARRGAILHDIGKMSVADNILLKPEKLTDKERATMEKHPETAYALLSPIPFLKKALDIPYCHHEKWDGSGYPRGLKGEEIPLAARIFAVADVWDAVSGERPYKKAWSREKALAYFIEQSGKHFDPRVINIFLEMLHKGEI
ncbi:MAG: histidine kinase N-terminal 7TM domain-containing protein [Anaerolineales bacterium]|nr:histidine kinase N-terminal 7TM domain-containing protein [Anaerolineales bacterium]